MKKIALLVPTFYYGGSKRSVSNIANLLSKKNDVIVVQFDSSQNVYSCSSKIVNMNIPASKFLFMKIVNRFRRIIRYRKILRNYSVDLSISFMDGANAVNFFAPKKCKKVISCRGYGDLLRLEKKYSLMLTRVDGILFNSKEMHSYYDLRHPDLAYKTFSLNNVFNERDYIKQCNHTVEQEFIDFADKHRIIVCLGRLGNEKGHVHLMKSFEILRKKLDVRLVIIGDGIERHNIEKMIKQSSFKNDILLMGYRKNPYKYLKYCDVGVLTSQNEGFPNVIIELLGNKIPVVSVDCMTGPYEILHGERKNREKVKELFIANYGILTPEFTFPCRLNIDDIDREHIVFSEAIEILLTNDSIMGRYKDLSYKRFKDFSFDVQQAEYNKFVQRIVGD
ncbi:MAG: glycosyltransferase [Tenericutes bacterium]|nr:glycosyltransferase [Mycoplasmatota bacterium]